MLEKATNQIIEALKTAVGWLRLAVKVQEAVISGMESTLDALKMGD